MIINLLLNRGSLVLFWAIAVFAFAPETRALEPADEAKRAGAIPLTFELLDKIDKFVKTVSSDPAAIAEWNASSKDSAISSDSPSTVINSKYPKLAAAFKVAGLSPEDFVKAFGAILASGPLTESDAPLRDKNAAANVAFCKANMNRLKSTILGLDALDKGADSSSSASPSTSPASSP